MANEITTTTGGADMLQRWGTPSSLGEAMEMAKIIADSDIVPKEHKGKAGNVLVVMQFAQDLGLSIMAALQTVSVINGKPSLWGDGPLAVCKQHPQWGDIREGHEGTTAWCEVDRAGQSTTRVTFSVEDAKRAGLWGKSGPWKQYPQRMLQMRARGFALRDSFPDALRGINIAEEVMDIPEPKVVKATASGKPMGVVGALAAAGVKASAEPKEVDESKDARQRLVNACLDAGYRGWGECAPVVQDIIGREITQDAPPTEAEVDQVVQALAERGEKPDREVSAADFVAQTKADEEPAPEHYDEVPF